MNQVTSRFDPLAERFERSSVHRDGLSLAKAELLLGDLSEKMICDLGCGAGHLGQRLGRFARKVVFVDPSAQMLGSARRSPNLNTDAEFMRAFAENIPLPSESVDVVASRLAAHHFEDLSQSLSEAFRILKPGGRLILIDLIGPSPSEDFDLFRKWGEIERLHDPSHQHDWYPARVIESIRDAGFSIQYFEDRILENSKPISLKTWCEMTQISEADLKKIEDRLCSLSSHQLEKLGWGFNEGFELRVPVFLAIGEKSYAHY